MNAERKQANIVAEPRDDQYRTLLQAGRTLCTRLSFVERPEVAMSVGGRSILKGLQKDLRASREASEWPGTKLLVGSALVRDYYFTDAVEQLMLAETEGLYEWVQPERPEDPVLWRADETPWLVTIAHERDAYLFVTPDELADVLERWPQLAALLPPAEDL